MQKLSSWLDVPPDSDFSIYNLPYGVFSTETLSKRVGVAIGQQVLDLQWLEENGYFDELSLPQKTFAQPQVNDFIKLGKEVWSKMRALLQHLLSDVNSRLKADVAHALYPIELVETHLPLQIGNYTDFYSSKEHATNIGTMFRDPDNALLPNWKHLPVGYHGRASSIVISGTEIRRPNGQMQPGNTSSPIFGPSKLLDFELETAFVVGKPNDLGNPVTIGQAEDHIFGVLLFNDWSARDIQKWEYVPLGPFLAKSFASSLSPWIVTMEALEPFRTRGPVQDPPVLPYLKFKGEKSYDIRLEGELEIASGERKVLCRTNHKYLYWNMAQQLTHHTVNGCNLQVGDLCASGTISGPTPDSYGSMLELSWRGEKPLSIGQEQRKFLQDGDTVIMRGHCTNGAFRIGFGEVRTRILPALSLHE